MDKEPDVTNDQRNVTDEFRGRSIEDIREILDGRRMKLHIAIENLERDFNMGTIVRSANAFNVEAIHIVGRKQWNKRGAMVTDRYMNIHYHQSVEEFVKFVNKKIIIGVDNIPGSKNLSSASLPEDTVLVFGSEGSGLSNTMIKACHQIVEIEQFGSTRSINVGVAAGVVMYQWLRENVL